MARVPAAHRRDGRYSKDDFDIDLDEQAVTCPAGQVAPVRCHEGGGGVASVGPVCAVARWRCTTNRRRRECSICCRSSDDPGW